ncbi:alcohol oxidase [Exidia glandulosa HHB12029]|uniref:Alcohol oxidase n=1 Tax=Exidia glandulosa HHB12029 TaxID=1314781 RepID=A0A165DN92_EXIGL|nr:alcohol oxidase [Exidia glandulosa HHB12029]
MNLPAAETDIIIVGAGAAGCIIAARLAAADPTLRITLLEGGRHTLNDPAVTTPGAYLNHLIPGAPYTRFITSEPSEHLGGRYTTVQAGGCVGGGTAINFMMYTRGAASDYDDWEVEHENPGWGFESLLPMFEKFETCAVDGAVSNHGSTGPVHVSLGGNISASAYTQEYLDVVAKYDKGRPIVSDFNEFHTNNAYAKWPKYIDSKGHRQDVGHRFLYPALEAPNSSITLKVRCIVTKVLFDGTRAVGVEFKDLSSGDEQPTTSILTANKLVVLAAGPLSSALILERSGIGSKATLAAAGIDVKVELPGVGENYQDHNLVTAAFIAAPGTTGDRDAYLRGEEQLLAQATARYERDGTGPLATNAIEVGVKVWPTEEERNALGEDFLREWAYFERSRDKPVILAGVNAGLLLPGSLPEGEYFTALAMTGYPFSRGSIHIRSSGVDDPPTFVPGYLSHPADVKLLMWQYKFGRERARRMPCYCGELAPTHPPFSSDSEAACVAPREGPVAIDAPDIHYTEEDDKVLEAWIRQTVSTTWHAMSTCSMKPREKGGVVDPKLNVYGVEGLKVADLSICPGNVGANTAATAMAIGEKAAVLIAQELGIAVV